MAVAAAVGVALALAGCGGSGSSGSSLDTGVASGSPAIASEPAGSGVTGGATLPPATASDGTPGSSAPAGSPPIGASTAPAVPCDPALLEVLPPTVAGLPITPSSDPAGADDPGLVDTVDRAIVGHVGTEVLVHLGDRASAGCFDGPSTDRGGYVRRRSLLAGRRRRGSCRGADRRTNDTSDCTGASRPTTSGWRIET